MTTTPFTLRAAQIDDAVVLRDLAIRTFCDTFSDSTQPDDMAAYLQDAFSLARIKGELSDACNYFLLLFLDGETLPCGYAKLRTDTPDECVSGDRPIELARLYVDKAVLRQGVGSRLMRAAVQKASALGYDTLWLGVWEYNHRAIAFYKRWGFEVVGSHPFILGSDHQTDWIMQRSTESESQ